MPDLIEATSPQQTNFCGFTESAESLDFSSSEAGTRASEPIEIGRTGKDC